MQFNVGINRRASCSSGQIGYSPLRGCSYITTPRFLIVDKTIINIHNNDDNECFKWAIISAHFKPDGVASRITLYQHTTHPGLLFNDLTYPVQ